MHERQAQTVDANIDDRERDRALAAAIERSGPAEPPRIWVGSIPAYEAGTPRGRWLSAARSVAQLEDSIEAARDQPPGMRKPRDDTAWGVFAAQGFGRHRFGASASLDEITSRARAARDDARAFAAWAKLDEGNRTHCERFPDAYQGYFDRLTDWVTLQVEAAGYDQLLDERIPSQLRPFVDIDIDALAHDLVAGGEVVAVDDEAYGGVWVFSPLAAQRASQSN